MFNLVLIINSKNIIFNRVVLNNSEEANMTEEINQPLPTSYAAINEATQASGFSMASDVLTCSLLRTLAATKPAAKFLERGNCNDLI